MLPSSVPGPPPADALVQPLVQPLDAHNRALLGAVHPADWINPAPAERYGLVVIGAGTAGLVTAAGAAGLGARVALVERGLMGGDCLNVGCVPSKALLRTAKAVGEIRRADDLGVRLPDGDVTVDFGAVMERMRRLRAQIAPHDGAERFRGLGVDVFLGDAAFTGPDTLTVGDRTLRFRRAVIATGARPAVPPIPGLDDAGYYTNETIFQLTHLPQRLVVIGGGPIGCELAQCFARFGSEVTILEALAGILARDDAEAVQVVRAALEADGIRIICGGTAARVESRDGTAVVHATGGGTSHAIEADAILVATGRRPNIDGLGADAAGVATGPGGIVVDDRLRTDNPAIFAAGDCCSAWKFTHAADAMARIAVQNALFPMKAQASALTIPWCTYTDPALAHVGPSHAELVERFGATAVRTFTVPFAGVDRAVLDGATAGFLRIHTVDGGRVAAATIVGRHAGDLIGEAALAVTHRLHMRQLQATIHPYPTLGEAFRRAGDAWRKSSVSPMIGALLGWFARRV